MFIFLCQRVELKKMINLYQRVEKGDGGEERERES